MENAWPPRSQASLWALYKSKFTRKPEVTGHTAVPTEVVGMPSVKFSNLEGHIEKVKKSP